jgi:D-alanyl-D-alanine carboxypeptidase
VSAAALRLVEDGSLALDASVAELLPGAYDDLLRGGGYDTTAITLRHLLTHTSGIYDFAADAYTDQIEGGFTSVAEKDPGRRWTRFEQIEFAVTHGEPYGAPGTVFGYSDTGACLVGEIIERVTGATMGAAIRSLVGYERLGLTTTWQETIEPDPAALPPLSHQYEGAIDVADFDASVDLYGGGGLMSTCADLARFFRGLLRGDVYRDPATLAAMTTTLDGLPRAPLTSDDPVSDAAMFLFRAEIDGETWWGHDGYWGTSAYTCPTRDVTIVAGHQRSDMPEDFDRMAIVRDAVAALDEGT